MSLLEVTTTGGYTNDRWDYYELNSLSMVTEIRPVSGGEPNEEEYRKVLRLSGTWLIKEITKVEVPLNALTVLPYIDVRVSGGAKVTITPGTGMEQFSQMSQEITPNQDQGWGVNNWTGEWVSQTEASTGDNGFQTVDWQGPIKVPEHTVTTSANVAADVNTSYVDCDKVESAATFNEYREQDSVDQFRTKISFISFYDIDVVTAITGLNAEIYRVPTLGGGGYNNDSDVGIIAAPFEFPRKFLLTEFSVVPLQQMGGQMARVKYRWDLWTNWQDM